MFSSDTKYTSIKLSIFNFKYTNLLEIRHTLCDEECSLFLKEPKFACHALPHGPKLRQTVMSYWLMYRDYRAMDLGISIRLSQESHAKGTKVRPKKEIEGMERVCASASMLVVVLTTNLSFSCQLNTAVIEKSFTAHFCINLYIHCLYKINDSSNLAQEKYRTFQSSLDLRQLTLSNCEVSFVHY